MPIPLWQRNMNRLGGSWFDLRQSGAARVSIQVSGCRRYTRLSGCKKSTFRSGLDSSFPLCSLEQMVEYGELSFKVVRIEPTTQEVLARAGNILIARAAFDVAVSLYQTDEIELRQGSRILRSNNGGTK